MKLVLYQEYTGQISLIRMSANFDASCICDTSVAMFLGGTKKISELKRGDIVMGDDCQGRIVLNVRENTDKKIGYVEFDRLGG